MPNSHVVFLEHQSSWEIRHLRWEKEQAEYSWLSAINWPKEFGVEVLETFRLLKERHAELLGRL